MQGITILFLLVLDLKDIIIEPKYEKELIKLIKKS